MPRRHEDCDASPAMQCRHEASFRTCPIKRQRSAKELKVASATFSRASSSGSRTSISSSCSSTSHTSSSSSSHHTKSAKISSGNRFYADVIAKQQKEHMMMRQKARESLHIATPSVPTTRAQSAPEFTRVSSTTTLSHVRRLGSLQALFFNWPSCAPLYQLRRLCETAVALLIW